MLRLAEAYADHPRVWVSQGSPMSDRLAADGAEVHVLPEYDRSLRRGHWIERTFVSLRLAIRLRPRVVVTTGSGVVVPFCVFARLLGARVIMIETSARVLTPSKAGRFIGRFAHTTLVQWEPLLAVYRRGRLCRPSVYEQVQVTEPDAGRHGTFVAVGTHDQQFDRLLAMVDDAVEGGVLDADVTAQSGVSTYQPRSFQVTPYLDREDVEERIAKARYVVCHAGIGMISTSLNHGIRPMVLARTARHGEHFDDHQAQIVRRLAADGLIVRLDDALTADRLGAADDPLCVPAASAVPTLQDELARQLREVL